MSTTTMYRLARSSGAIFSRSISLVKARGISSGNFVVRTLTTPEEIRDEVCERSAKQGWRPGALDHISYYAADKTGFFVGELDGNTIGCMSVVKYTSSFAFIGHYIMDEPYKDKGLGIRMWNAALASINDSYNISGDSVLEKVDMYSKLGVKLHWYQQYYDLVAATAVRALKDFKPPKPLKVQSVSDELFPRILKYDKNVNSFPRQGFLKEWLFAPNCYASVALDNRDNIVGYAVVRKMLREEEGWKIGPCFADNSVIARSLYSDLCEKVADASPDAVIAACVPCSDIFDQEALKIVVELSGRPKLMLARLYRYGIHLGMSLKKIFALTPPELG